jgi:hypothetical protein
MEQDIKEPRMRLFLFLGSRALHLHGTHILGRKRFAKKTIAFHTVRCYF